MAVSYGTVESSRPAQPPQGVCRSETQALVEGFPSGAATSDVRGDRRDRRPAWSSGYGGRDSRHKTQNGLATAQKKRPEQICPTGRCWSLRHIRPIRNDYDNPKPLILHRRLRQLVYADCLVRSLWATLLRRDYRAPRYMRPAMSEHERILLRESIRNFAGGRSPDPVVSRHCRERSRQALLNDPEIPEGRKQQLHAAAVMASHETPDWGRLCGKLTRDESRYMRLRGCRIRHRQRSATLISSDVGRFDAYPQRLSESDGPPAWRLAVDGADLAGCHPPLARAITLPAVSRRQR